jgi:glycosyltransferase involved in cell wall biosynthesis
VTAPLVSVLIDTYNHERFIDLAVKSVLGQQYPDSDREILVVDDGSTDATPDILRKFEPNVRILRKQNGGQASAFNCGIPQCRGKIVAFLDGDDWWTKDKLPTIVDIFKSHPEVGAVGHGFYFVDSDGKLQKTVVPKQTHLLNARTPGDAAFFSRHGGFFGASKVAYRKEILDRILPIPEGAIVEADEWMYTLAPCLANVMVLDQPLFYYRLHRGNMFVQDVQDEQSLRRKYNSLVALVQNLPPKMRALGISPEIEEPLLAHLRLQTELFRLQLEGGSRRETLQFERATENYFVGEAPLGYRIFKQFVFLMALTLPSKQFFRLKKWYSKSALRRMRAWLGDPPPSRYVDEQSATSSRSR